MKKFRLISALLMLFGLTATAQESISVNEVLIAPGKQAMMEVMFHFNEDHDYVSYQFKVNLPDGISFVADDDDQVIVELGDGQPTARFSKEMPVSSAIMKGFSNPSTVIAANDGVLVKIAVIADDDIEVDTELTGSITGVVFAHSNAVGVSFSDANFKVKMTEKTILDENYTWTPFATDAATDLIVKRTINAGEWSTICFPFAMSADKLAAAFGDNYDLEEFTGYDVEKDGNDKVIGLTLNFTKNTKAAKINTPYIIKTTQDVTEFEVNAKVNPGNPIKTIVVEDDETGEEVVIASVTGTFKAGTIVPKNSLFLSGNQFWYSAGLTKMKGFRGYFTLNDVLADVINAGAKVSLNFGGETTDVKQINGNGNDDRYYDLQGRHVQNPSKKGLYINNGKKEVVK